ncbi:11S globulin seed storage protein 1-like [Euphorbia lathyris]|uniref:11S globulin seed storage protein 1-like n=1 Tax=Euphorbia lathyris TaxID=212925 RepID=UPI00331335BF
MAAPSSLYSLSLIVSLCCFLFLFQNGSAASQNFQQRSRQDECQLHRINAVEPSRRVQSEAGLTEIWDENDRQFQCAGVVAIRHVIRERGLLLPHYSNGPKLIYVIQGNGVEGAVFPGCPETYQSASESESEQHQKVRQIRQGDVIALPAGVAHWIHNNGRSPLVLVQIIDTSNSANQLDHNHRIFFIAGKPQQEVQSQRGEGSRSHLRGKRGEEERSRGSNILSGFDEELLAEAFNINTDLAKRLQSQNDKRGIIVNVEGELEFVSPQQSREEEHSERRRRRLSNTNGIEETFCTGSLKHNIDNPSEADVYNPEAGHITSVNSHTLPVLRFLGLSIEKGVLYKNGIVSPHWNINAHSIYYFTRGRGRVQIVNENGEAVFDAEVREEQIITVPQNFVVVKRAASEGLEWVAFKTNHNAQISQLAGRVSAIRALPDDVVANAFQVSREDARRLKYNRHELTVFAPGRGSSSI